jgi:predicted phosphoserine aminotransferase
LTHRKLFIPGPVEVRPRILEQMARPLIGHRSAEMAEMFNRIRERLRAVFVTRQEVLVGTCSGSGLLEAAVRNLVSERCLALTCGAFSERWAETARACGRQVDILAAEWGEPNLPEALEARLRGGRYEAVLVVHNESATGLTNPLAELAEVVRRHPETLLLVDAVTALAGLPLEVDRLGIDVAVTSSQKALALPPGLAFASVSERAFERAGRMAGKGFVHDFTRMRQSAQKGQTPATPSVSHLYALDRQLEDLLHEGLEARWRRHAALGEMCRRWASGRFALFPRQGYESNTVTCIRNTRGIDVDGFRQELAQRGFAISNGYGKLKQHTFRIGHMGDVTPAEMEELLGAMDEALAHS